MVLTSVLQDVIKHPRVRISEHLTDYVSEENVKNLFERFEYELSRFNLSNDSFGANYSGEFYLLKPDRNLRVEQIENLLKSLKLSKRIVIDVQAYTEVTLLLKFIIAFQAQGYELYGYVPLGTKISLDFRNV
jgi:hypothetical protein